jgi:hypothetical protein
MNAPDERKSMNKIRLKNAAGLTIGILSTLPSGKLWLTTRTGHTLGYYFPTTNRTVGPEGRIVGRGNILTSLLPDDDHQRR